MPRANAIAAKRASWCPAIARRRSHALCRERGQPLAARTRATARRHARARFARRLLSGALPPRPSFTSLRIDAHGGRNHLKKRAAASGHRVARRWTRAGGTLRRPRLRERGQPADAASGPCARRGAPPRAVDSIRAQRAISRADDLLDWWDRSSARPTVAVPSTAPRDLHMAQDRRLWTVECSLARSIEEDVRAGRAGEGHHPTPLST